MRSFFAGFLYFLEQNFALCFSSPSYFFNKLYYRKITLGITTFFFLFSKRREDEWSSIDSLAVFFRAYVTICSHSTKSLFLSLNFYNNFHPFEKIGVVFELLKIHSRWSFFWSYISRRTYDKSFITSNQLEVIN